MRLFGGGKPRVPADGPAVSTAVVLYDAERRLLALVGAESFGELESEAAERVALGYAPGRIISDGHGSLRRKSYATTVEAGLDARIAVLEDRDDLQAPEARRLEPLGGRWALLRDLRGLDDSRTPQSAVEAHYAASRDPAPSLGSEWPALPDDVDPQIANSVAMRRARADVERANRERRIAAFEERERDRVRDLMRDPFSNATERARIEVALRRWNDDNQGLIDELCAEAARAR